MNGLRRRAARATRCVKRVEGAHYLLLHSPSPVYVHNAWRDVHTEALRLLFQGRLVVFLLLIWVCGIVTETIEKTERASLTLYRDKNIPHREQFKLHINMSSKKRYNCLILSESHYPSISGKSYIESIRKVLRKTPLNKSGQFQREVGRKASFFNQPLVNVRRTNSMLRTLRLLLLAIALPSVFPTSASQEGVLTFNTFQISSPGIGQSGPVVVSGEQNSNQIVSLTVQAFGHTVILSKD